MRKKHIILIIADQMRADVIGSHAGSTSMTPHIDELASHGISFSQTITPAPLCGPARCSMFTGKYPHQAKGVLLEDNLGVRTPEERPLNELTDMMTNDSSVKEPPTLTTLLKQSGYETAYAGKWHLGNDCIHSWFEKAYGYDNNDYVQWLKDQNLPEDGWPLKDSEVKTHRTPHMSIPKPKVNPISAEQSNDAWIADIAVDYIKHREKEKPLFLVCGFNGPHPPFKVPEPYYSMYDPKQYAEPKNFYPAKGEPESKKHSFYRTLWKDHGDSWAEWQKSVAVYHGFCTLIDDQVGKIVDCLKQENMFEDSLILFTSDHGEQLGQHGLWHKMQPYEESLHVPLVASVPTSETQGKHIDAPVSLIDIPTTILSTAGCTIPDEYEGVDLLDIQLKDRNRYLFSEQKSLGTFHKEHDWRLIFDGTYKYVFNRNDCNELYDLSYDPYETVNLIDNRNYASIRNSLAAQLTEWMMQTKDELLKEGTPS